MKKSSNIPVVTAKKTKIAVLSVSAGAGHVRAAQALQAAAERYFPEVEVVHIDVMDLVPKIFRKIYIDSYIKLVESHPAIWGYLYNRTDHENSDDRMVQFRIAVERLNTRKILSTINDIAPDHVICTHFLPAQLLSRKISKGRFNLPVWVTVTDFDVHNLWLQEHITGYFAANDEVGWRMVERGIPGETVHVTGIPIMPVFSDNFSRAACAAEFGLNPDKKTLLMMSGGAGVGELDVMAERLMGLSDGFQLVALAGKNAKLLASLNAIAAKHPGRLFPLPFTRVIERAMAASDAAITKPGGLTSSECMAMGLPMIVVSPIPGQEERNSDYLLENGAAMKACDTAALEYRIHGLMKDPTRLDSLRENAKRLGRPDAARLVLEKVLSAQDITH